MAGFKPEMYIPSEDKWHGNGLVFATEEEALAWGRDLLMRWFVPTDNRAVATDEEPNYVRLDNGQIATIDGDVVKGAR